MHGHEVALVLPKNAGRCLMLKPNFVITVRFPHSQGPDGGSELDERMARLETL